MESMDVFESTPLFQNSWPKLLKAALDAAKMRLIKSSPAKLAELGEAQSFLEEN